MHSLALKLSACCVGLAIVWIAQFRLRSTTSRQTVFLLASYAFYLLWGTWFLSILVFSSIMNYVAGVFLRRKPSAGRLWMGMGLNLALLGGFKYWPALSGLAHAGSVAKSSSLLIPLGISFWTFQALSYLIDIYRGEDVNPTLLELMLYLSFWSTVISGPICRASSMIRQFRSLALPVWQDVATGTRRICIGLLMIGIGELLGSGIAGQGVTANFNRSRWTALDVWLLVIGYGFQLFFDFAGYSHVVIGVAKLFGIELQENFDRPFLASSPSAFWTRWHMSLSFWIRDYVFLSLASQRRDLWWRKLSLAVAMVMFGLWHGATVLYLLWGAYHGALLVLHRQWQEIRRRMELPRMANWALGPLSWCVTFAAISLGWILFRAHDLRQAASMFAAIFSWKSYRAVTLPPDYVWLVMLVIGGYFATVGAAWRLDRVDTPRLPTPIRPALQVLARNRWVWVTPAIVVLALYAFLLVGVPGNAASPLLYRVF